MKITDKKELGKEFKYFKTHYVSLNFGYKSVYIYPKNNEIKMVFLPTNQFSIIAGRILNCETEFLKWCSSHHIIANIEDFIKIGKCLQKNTIEIDYDNESFKFKFLNKDGNEEEINFSTISDVDGIDINQIVNKIENIESSLVNKKVFALSDEYFNGELFEVYYDNINDIFPLKNKTKIIEIEKKEIKGFLKNMDSSNISFSDLDSLSHRFVKISSSDSNLSLELSQYFVTL